METAKSKFIMIVMFMPLSMFRVILSRRNRHI